MYSSNNGSYSYSFNTNKRDKFNNVELTIHLNIAFKQINPVDGCSTGMYPDHNKTNRQINKWLPSEWEQWKQDFVKTVEGIWDGKFWLKNDDQFPFIVKGKTYVPNIWCRLKLTVSDTQPECAYHGSFPTPTPMLPHEHNHIVEVIKVDKSEPFFRSDAGHFTNRDMDSDYTGIDSCGDNIYQITVGHEVGHLLNLGHINDHKIDCVDNNAQCYGVTDKEMRSIMGRGNELRYSDADPWRQCMIQDFHVGSMNHRWLKWEPSLRRIYPRTLHEVNTNKEITIHNLHRYR